MSAVLKLEEDLAQLSHFTDPGAPECERCAQPEKHGDGKRFFILVMLFRLLACYLLKWSRVFRLLLCMLAECFLREVAKISTCTIRVADLPPLENSCVSKLVEIIANMQHIHDIGCWFAPLEIHVSRNSCMLAWSLLKSYEKIQYIHDKGCWFAPSRIAKENAARSLKHMNF